MIFPRQKKKLSHLFKNIDRFGVIATNPILHKIIGTKREEILDTNPSLFPKNPSPVRSLSASLKETSFPAVIAECKRKSPSAGTIRENFDPVSIAKIYESLGARAISVLTDREYFGGSLDDLQNVSSAVSIPVLRKDFILDEVQIEEARAYGASCILLIVRILEPAVLKRLLEFSYSLGMDVLVETHTEEEVHIALDSGAEIIGINTRDLDHFKIYPDLIPKLAKIIPSDKIKIGESGIHNRSDWEPLNGIVDGLLIGSHFMKSPDIEKSYRDLLY